MQYRVNSGPKGSAGALLVGARDQVGGQSAA
jgi:hypothetical protein